MTKRIEIVKIYDCYSWEDAKHLEGKRIIMAGSTVDCWDPASRIIDIYKGFNTRSLKFFTEIGTANYIAEFIEVEENEK